MEGITNQGSSSSLYISGMPGTGKTVTTLETIKNILKEKKEEKKKRKSGETNYNSKMKNVEYIHINAMNLTNPNLVYTILAEKIIGRRMNPQSAAQFLDEFFKKKDKK
jgi:Cdc6-like AAA superfamily ATPase